MLHSGKRQADNRSPSLWDRNGALILKKFIYATDLHYGWERRAGHKVALHDSKALSCMLAFAKEFKPDVFIWGGDALDCGVISHHNHGKPGATEGMKLIADAAEGKKAFIDPVEKLMGDGELVYITGNHERWLNDLTDKLPSLEGLVDLVTLLGLQRWKVIPQGGAYNLGKLTFIHGDTLKGGEAVAKNAVVNYERSVRFGHFHTYQVYTKNTALDYKNGKTGIAVPCLCGKTPKYGAGAPNRWMQGFLYGYVMPGGNYNDYVATIIEGKTVINGREYRG